MCLINKGLKYQGSIRWKFVEFREQVCSEGRLAFNSPSFRAFEWRKNNNYEDYFKKYSSGAFGTQFGFHVFLFKQTAINAAKGWDGTHYNDYFIFKLRCSNFIDGGIIDRCDEYSDGKRGERWENAEVIGIFDLNGKDVTKQYEKYLL